MLSLSIAFIFAFSITLIIAIKNDHNNIKKLFGYLLLILNLIATLYKIQWGYTFSDSAFRAILIISSIGLVIELIPDYSDEEVLHTYKYENFNIVNDELTWTSGNRVFSTEAKNAKKEYTDDPLKIEEKDNSVDVNKLLEVKRIRKIYKYLWFEIDEENLSTYTCLYRRINAAK